MLAASTYSISIFWVHFIFSLSLSPSLDPLKVKPAHYEKMKCTQKTTTMVLAFWLRLLHHSQTRNTLFPFFLISFFIFSAYFKRYFKCRISHKTLTSPHCYLPTSRSYISNIKVKKTYLPADQHLGHQTVRFHLLLN